WSANMSQNKHRCSQPNQGFVTENPIITFRYKKAVCSQDCAELYHNGEFGMIGQIRYSHLLLDIGQETLGTRHCGVINLESWR
ncbi:MAG: hypothetical protein ACRC0J_14780, partial [Shewanella oncorhynchi]